MANASSRFTSMFVAIGTNWRSPAFLEDSEFLIINNIIVRLILAFMQMRMRLAVKTHYGSDYAEQDDV